MGAFFYKTAADLACGNMRSDRKPPNLFGGGCHAQLCPLLLLQRGQAKFRSSIGRQPSMSSWSIFWCSTLTPQKQL